GMDHARAVAHNDILVPNAESFVVRGGGDRGGTGTGEHHAHVLDALANDFECVQERGTRDDRRPVLVVVEDGNLHRLPKGLFDVEAVGRPDILEVDPADRRLEQLTEANEVVRVFPTAPEVDSVRGG